MAGHPAPMRDKMPPEWTSTPPDPAATPDGPCWRCPPPSPAPCICGERCTGTTPPRPGWEWPPVPRKISPILTPSLATTPVPPPSPTSPPPTPWSICPTKPSWWRISCCSVTRLWHFPSPSRAIRWGITLWMTPPPPRVSFPLYPSGRKFTAPIWPCRRRSPASS